LSWIPDIIELKNVYYDFGKLDRYDFMGLGIAEGGGNVLARVAEGKETYSEAKKVISDLPMAEKEVALFNVKHDQKFKRPIPVTTIRALENKRIVYEGVFEPRGITYDVQKALVQARVVCLDFGITSLEETQRMRARLFGGKIIQELSKNYPKK